jgi:TusA-related sulfurtransferase
MELIKNLKQGQVLEILTDCDGGLEDIAAWCAKHGQVTGIQQNVTEKKPGHASLL